MPNKFKRYIFRDSYSLRLCWMHWFVSHLIYLSLTKPTMQQRVHPSAKHFLYKQVRNEVRWHPGQETSLAPPCSNLRSLGSQFAVEDSTCDIARTFRRLLPGFGARGIVSLLPLSRYASVYRYITPSFAGYYFLVKGESWYFCANLTLCILI